MYRDLSNIIIASVLYFREEDCYTWLYFKFTEA